MTLSVKNAKLKHTAAAVIAASFLGACSSFHQNSFAPDFQAYGLSQQSMPVVKQTDLWSILTRKTGPRTLRRSDKNPGSYPIDGQNAAGPLWSDIYSGQLRAAPQPNYNFAAHDSAVRGSVQPVLNTLSRRTKTAMITPRFKHFLDSSAPHIAARPAVEPALNAQYGAKGFESPPAHIPAAAAPMHSSEPQSLSYVKMGGGSQIADWQACETQAGGYFITSPNGFSVEPGFDSCMRAKGYKPEAEAQAELDLASGGAP
jgi:hypothetical protein